MTQPPAKSKHSRIGASGAYRWMVCTGSPAMIDKAPPQTQSVWAAEGTAAHKVGELCLKTGNNASRYVGNDFDGVECTEEMAEAVQVYIDAVRGDMQKYAGSELLVEQAFDLAQILLGLFGTNDAVVYQAFGRLIIYDYKHGAGNAVEVVDNKQLLYYALGAILNLLNGGGDFESVELVIVQPRAMHRDGHVRRWVVDVPYVMEFAKELEKKARETMQPDAPLVAGDHCKWCPAKAFCPALAKLVVETAAMDFPEPVPPAPRFPAPEQLTPAQLKKALDLSEVINDWIRSVEAYAEECAKRGVQIPGYKLVKKRANRKWVDEKAVVETLAEYGEAIFEPKVLLSPAKVEKIVGKKNLLLIETLCETPDTGLCLVSESDKREAVVPPMISDFTQ